MKTRSKIEMFVCEKCKKTFQTQSEMKKHENEHIGEEVNLCCICATAFKTQTELNNHEKTHLKKIFMIARIVKNLSKLDQSYLHIWRYMLVICHFNARNVRKN